jgi:hypothetical protein
MRKPAFLLATVVTLALPADAPAGAFFGWQVTGVRSSDVLNIRSYPNNEATILTGYRNGAPISLTGRCTGGVLLDRIAGEPDWRQRQAVRYRWCEVVLGEGEGDRIGWVYGKYIRPM